MRWSPAPRSAGSATDYTTGAGTYAKDPARIVLVVCDAAVAHSPMGHDGVEAGIRHGDAPAAAWWLGAVDEGVDGGIAAVVFLYFGVAPPPDEEKGGTYDGGENADADDDANSNANRAASTRGAAAVRCLRRDGRLRRSGR